MENYEYCDIVLPGKLPTEMWDRILRMLEDSDDIVNFLEAFPNLRGLSEKKETSWLIGGVLPFIMSKYLSNKDVLNCRLVSKTWNIAIEKCMETHPDQFPHKSKSTLSKITEDHFCYRSRYFPVANLGSILKSENENTITNSMKHNPFLGRKLLIHVQNAYGRSYFGREAINLIDAIPILKRFEHQLWHVDFVLHQEHGNTYFLENMLVPMLQCLNFLPNLRSLGINGTMPYMNPGRVRQLLTEPVVVSPHLHTLVLSNLHVFFRTKKWFARFLNAYFRHCYRLKKLKIKLHYWDSQLKFRSLNELQLVTRSESSNEIIERIQCVLTESCFSKSGKLVISNCLYLKINDLLKIIEPYDVEVLELNNIIDEAESIPNSSIKRLKFNHSEDIKYIFLKSLTSLQFLHIEIGQYTFESTTKENCFLASSICSYFDSNMVEARDFSIWNILPSLQMLSITNGNSVRRYLREYENKCFFM